MRARAGIITAVLVALALTGCSGAVGGESDAVETTPPATSPSVEAAPATVAPSAEPEVDLDAYFLDSSLVSQIDLSDEEKLSAARFACEQVEGGASVDDVVAVEGISANLNSAFVRDSVVVFCPDAAEL